MLEGMNSMKINSDTKRLMQAEAKRKLPFLVATGNEQDIIAYAKAWNPEITQEQLHRVVRLFRAAKLARAHSPQSG